MRSLCIPLLFVLGACSHFQPQTILYENDLIPISYQAEEDRYAVDEDGAVTYTLEGLRMRVESMGDAELNAIFPEESTRGQFSTNPYTYGNWIDPLVGHTPKRFTVFRVTVINDIYAKTLLDPIRALLYTDQGELLHSYGLPAVSPHNSFERYYRSLRGQSGNEFYRFDLRMGNVRSTAYLEDVRVFKGESYSGFLAFDPLDDEVKQVRLTLKDFVLKFDASGQPLDMVDISMEFDQHIQRTVVAPQTATLEAQSSE
ncbi:MAG: hypothetical protein VX733_05100 [Candidatus Latescibacterota bacterium]|nr:hypothetical protein [Candidatus Latescibacterota bacterium]